MKNKTINWYNLPTRVKELSKETVSAWSREEGPFDKDKLVTFEGELYISLIDKNSKDIAEETAWGKIKGEEGPQGPKGDTFTYEDMTPDQLESLKGDVISYNSLSESEKQDLADRVPVNGVVEEGNTQAVSGGEVFKSITDATISLFSKIGSITIDSLTVNNSLAGGVNYKRTGVVKIPSQCDYISFTSQVYGTKDVIFFYTIAGNRIVNFEPFGTIQNGVVNKTVKIPDAAFFYQIHSVINTHPNYVDFDFNLTFLQSGNYNKNKNVTKKYNFKDFDFIKTDIIGAGGQQYKTIRIPVVEGQELEVACFTQGGVAYMLINNNNEELQRRSGNSSASNINSYKVIIPSNCDYILINTIAEGHPNYIPQMIDSVFVNVYSTQDILLENLNNEINKGSQNLNIKKFDLIDFNINGIVGNASSSSYKRTEKIMLEDFTHVFVSVSTLSVSGLLFYNSNDELLFSTNFITGFTTQLFDIIEKPNGATYCIAQTITNEAHQGYNPNIDANVILGNYSDLDYYVNNELKKYYLNKNKLNLKEVDFSKVGYPTNQGASTYNRTNPFPIFKNTILDYNLNATGNSVWVYKNGYVNKAIPYETGGFESNDVGAVIFTTKNNTHPTYEIDKNIFADIYYNGFVYDYDKYKFSYLPTPFLKCMQEKTFKDGTDKIILSYLWYDEYFNFYTSKTKKGRKEFAFKWDFGVFENLPHYYSMGIDINGNIICVYRTEVLNQENPTENNRRNPIVLIKSEKYKSYVLDFGDDIKPSGWLQNSGFLSTDNALFFTEYTRPSVLTANTWKVNFPINNKANWERVQTFTLSGSNQTGLKHIHNVDIDPYTGIIYTSTGDDSSAAAIYYSKDNGETWFTAISGSEKYCRVLNWIFTKDYIYWATDSGGSLHWLFRASRKEDGTFDLSTTEDLEMFPTTEPPTYATIYLKKINMLLFLNRADGGRKSIKILGWDLINNNFVELDTITTIDNIDANIGFRCECFEYYPRENDIIVGFSNSLGLGSYANYISKLGNTNDAKKRVNNMIITINRINNEFNINYETTVI